MVMCNPTERSTSVSPGFGQNVREQASNRVAQIADNADNAADHILNRSDEGNLANQGVDEPSEQENNHKNDDPDEEYTHDGCILSVHPLSTVGEAARQVRFLIANIDGYGVCCVPVMALPRLTSSRSWMGNARRIPSRLHW